MLDEQIVDLFIKRDESAINETKNKFGTKLCRIADNILHNAEDSAECENETYLKAWNTIPPNEPRTYLFAYLAKIIRAVAINRFKANTAQKRNAEFCELTQEIETVLPAHFSAEKEYDAKKLCMLVNDFLYSQPPEKRNIFIRRYWFCDSVHDIAALYSLTDGKVKTVLFRVRADLKAFLEKEDYVI